MPEPRKASRPAPVSRVREGVSARGASGGLMMAAPERDRRRVDPRVALGVLVLLNVAVFASGAKAIELAAVAGDAALMLWCRRGRLACAWLSAYAALSLIALACILGGPFFMPTGSCLVMLARLFPTAMFGRAHFHDLFGRAGLRSAVLRALGAHDRGGVRGYALLSDHRPGGEGRA